MKKVALYLIVCLVIFGSYTTVYACGKKPTSEPTPEVLPSGLTSDQERELVEDAATTACNNTVDIIFRTGGYKNSMPCVDAILAFYAWYGYWPTSARMSTGSSEDWWVSYEITKSWNGLKVPSDFMGIPGGYYKINYKDFVGGSVVDVLIDQLYWGRIGLEGIGIK